MSRVAPLVFLVFPLLGCATKPVPPQVVLPDTGDPVLHAIQDAQLRHWMDEMNNRMFERMRTEIELDRERRRETLQIAAAAAALREAVGGILDTLPRLGLADAERTVFLTLADALRARVETLEIQARDNAVDALPATFDRIQATCMACHRLFRKFAPPEGDS